MCRNNNAALLLYVLSVNWVMVILAMMSEPNVVLIHEDWVKLDLSKGPSQDSLIGWVNHSLAVQLFPTHLQELIAQLVGE